MALVTVAGNDESLWIDTSGSTNIVVGVKGSSYQIQFHLGTDTHIFPAGKPSSGSTVIAKAAFIRVVNTGTSALNFEVLL